MSAPFAIANSARVFAVSSEPPWLIPISAIILGRTDAEMIRSLIFISSLVDYQAVRPPSTIRFWPVIYWDESLRRNNIAPVISDGEAIRFMGVRAE